MSRKSLFRGAQESENPSNQDRQQLVTSHTTGDTKVPVENDIVTHSGTPATQVSDNSSNQPDTSPTTDRDDVQHQPSGEHDPNPSTSDKKEPSENEISLQSKNQATQGDKKEPSENEISLQSKNQATQGDKKEPSENEISLQSKNQATQGDKKEPSENEISLQSKNQATQDRDDVQHQPSGEHDPNPSTTKYDIQDKAIVWSSRDKSRELCSTDDVSRDDGSSRNAFDNDETVIFSDACTKRYYGPNAIHPRPSGILGFPGRRVFPGQPTAPGNPPIPGNLVYPGLLTAPGNAPIQGNLVITGQLTAPGLGGFWYNGSTYHIFSYLFTTGLPFHNNVLEMLAIYVAVKLWGPLWCGKMVLAYCDNTCTVNIINGKERQKISIAQTLILELIKKEGKLHHFNLEGKHIQGPDNYKADMLSRYPSDEFIRKYGGSDSCVKDDAGPVLDKFVEICKQFRKKFIGLQILFPQNFEIISYLSSPTLFNISTDILATKLSTALMLPKPQDKFAKLFESVAKDLVEGRARDIVQEITHLQHELEINDDNEQYSRRNSLCIRGLPESKDENTEALVMEVLRDLHLDLTESDIDRCYRVGKKNMDRNRQVIVKFVNNRTRNKVISNKRMLRQNRSSVYIDEDLTKYRSKLFKLTRDLKARHLISSTWTYDGQVYVREQPGGVMRVIQRKSDLDRYR